MRAVGTRSNLSGTLLILALLVASVPAEAQVAGASAAALGMGDNYTALARGRNATAWNPANHALPDGPGFSISFAPIRAFAGISPVTLSDLAAFDGVLIPDAAKNEWLGMIAAEGRQRGEFGASFTALSLNIGRLGVQVSSTVEGRMDLGPDAAEILLFGNAGRTGDPRDLRLEGSGFDAAATTTVAVSYAVPLPTLAALLPGEHIAIGATVTRTVGNGLISAADNGSAATTDPLELGLAFPIIHTDTTFNFDSGSGYGLDVGAAWQGGPLTLGLVVYNLVNTFEWDAESFQYRRGTAMFRPDTSYTSFDAEPIAAAPDEVRSRAEALVEDLRYETSLAIGAALQLLPNLTISADIRRRLSERLEIVGPATHAGIGAEFRPLSFLPIRAGVTTLTGGRQYSGGFALDFGVINLGVAAAHRTTELGEGVAGMLSLSFGGN